MKTRIFIAGHTGMVGSALVREALHLGTYEPVLATRRELDLTDLRAVLQFLERQRPDCVIFAAAKVGGSLSNSTFPADFLYENLTLAANIVRASFLVGIKRLLFLGSSCIYPKFAPQPIPESALLSGALEETNEAYAIAKIAGLKLCAAYRKQHGVLFHSAMPTNLYGPGDNYHPDHSHVIPGLMHRFHTAKERGLKEVAIWGTGTPMREFLYVDDLASACFHLLTLDNPADWINVGFGSDVSIYDLSLAIAKTVGYPGQITLDPTKPDGTPRKLLDTSLLRSTGWQPQTPLEDGLKLAYADYQEALHSGRLRAL
jgi:GDP-L-fucose synthase